MARPNRPIVLVLNGPGSVGKSSVARALQKIAVEPFLHVAMDAFLDMLPERLFGHPEGLTFRPVVEEGQHALAVEAGETCGRLLAGMPGAVAALAQAGSNLIVDEVLLDGRIETYRRALAGLEWRLVGLTAPLEVLEDRERWRVDRDIGLARWQHRRVLQGPEHDLVLDASVAVPDEIARDICRAFGIAMREAV